MSDRKRSNDKRVQEQKDERKVPKIRLRRVWCSNNKVRYEIINPIITEESQSAAVTNKRKRTKIIRCNICGTQFKQFLHLRVHLEVHGKQRQLNIKALKNAPIFKILREDQPGCDVLIIAEFLKREARAYRWTGLYSIFDKFGDSLHIDDTDSESENEDEFKFSGAPSNHPKFKSQILPRKYQCDLCHMQFKRRYKALGHQKSAHAASNLKVVCYYCKEKFIGAQLLISHLMTRCKHSRLNLDCRKRFQMYLLRVSQRLVDYIFDGILNFDDKLDNHYVCVLCPRFFYSKWRLLQHHEKHKQEQVQTKRFEWQQLHEQVELINGDPSKLKPPQHFTVQAPTKIYCPVCKLPIVKKSQMIQHLQVHRAQLDPAPGTEAIMCSYCLHFFSDVHTFVLHLRFHMGKTPYICEFCSETFAQPEDLAAHKSDGRHARASENMCRICELPHRDMPVLKLFMHSYIHCGPYQCIYCDGTFHFAYQLANHLLHHGNRPGKHGCRVCGIYRLPEDVEMQFQVNGHKPYEERLKNPNSITFIGNCLCPQPRKLIYGPIFHNFDGVLSIFPVAVPDPDMQQPIVIRDMPEPIAGQIVSTRRKNIKM